MVRPAERRIVVQHMTTTLGLSCRRACGLVEIQRTVAAYMPSPDKRHEEVEALRRLASKYSRYGQEQLHTMMRRDGWKINHKRTERLYRLEGLSLRLKRKRKRARHLREALPVPVTRDVVWSMDFVHDALADGKKIKCLTLIDQCTRECLLLHADTTIKGKDVAKLLTRLKWRGRCPEVLVSDNGSEFTSKAMATWAHYAGVKLHFIEPGKPTQNGFTESFNGKFRYGCLDTTWFTNLESARKQIEEWRKEYNEVRPHSSLGGKTPKEFARQFEQKKLDEKSRNVS